MNRERRIDRTEAAENRIQDLAPGERWRSSSCRHTGPLMKPIARSRSYGISSQSIRV